VPTQSRIARNRVNTDKIGIMATKNKKTVSLVLGSGGARGLAHIGVIHWLEENDFKIESISGCSMGAVIGGIFAAGKLDDFESWVRAITKVDIVTLLDLSWNKSGLVKGDKIINSLTELVGDVAIEDLPIKYTAVAADILNEKEVWMNSGKLFDAIRASISLPLFFTPFRYKDVDLIDGGVLNPVPIAPTFSDETDLTLAVNLGGKVDADEQITTDRDFTGEDKSPFTQKITEFVESFRDSTVNHINSEWGAYDIANQAFDAMQSTIARQKLAAYPADYFIEIARNACGTLEFDLASEMIELGYKKAQESFSKIP
jgi:NTE family protein